MLEETTEKNSSDEETALYRTPEKLVNLLIQGEMPRKRAIKQLENEDSRHKQLLTTLLLQRMYALAQSTAKASGEAFV